jgi:hypothetical protein
MPVRRFRTVDEMNQPRWRQPGDPELYRAIAAVWALGRRTVVRRYQPGVYKHRSIESLNDQTEQWAARDFEIFQRTRLEPVPYGDNGRESTRPGSMRGPLRPPRR